MAGIGFRLQRLMERENYLSALQGYVHSAFICAGPWLLTMFTMFLLGIMGKTDVDLHHLLTFRATVTYAFAVTLIVFGGMYLSLNRYVSDRLYLKEFTRILPTCNTALVTMLLLQSAVGWALLRPGGEGLSLSWLSFLIFNAVGAVWVLMVFLSALKDYAALTRSFVFGMTLTAVAAFVFGRWLGIQGYFLGFLLGQVSITMMLLDRIYAEFHSTDFWDWRYFTSFVTFRKAVLAGIGYNLAVWADKIVFWCSSQGFAVSDLLRIVPEYENPMFLAYMTTLPGMMIFLVHTETDFYVAYRRFYQTIMGRGSRAAIAETKSSMIEALRRGMSMLLINQGLMTALVMLFAMPITAAFGMTPSMAPVFRIGVLGAFMQLLFLSLLIVILYFDFQGTAAFLALLYCVANAALTAYTITLGSEWYGYGYFVAGVIAAAAAYFLLDARLAKLEYYTFALQPVVAPKADD
jgi:uncharacterized membrane protein